MCDEYVHFPQEVLPTFEGHVWAPAQTQGDYPWTQVPSRIQSYQQFMVKIKFNQVSGCKLRKQFLNV